MIKYIDSKKMGKANHGWLDSHFHFSFADYYNPSNMGFGVLRVINDDLIACGTGFDTHPHRNMEIISYVINGELSHADSMNHQETIKRGHVQYMSAGTGVFHSEHNYGDETLRLLQIWIHPDQVGYAPQYGDYRFDWNERVNKWLHIVTGNQSNQAAIQIHADVNLYVTELTAGNRIDFKVELGRQAYLVLIEGEAIVDSYHLNERDALEIIEADLSIEAIKTSHLLVIEMNK